MILFISGVLSGLLLLFFSFILKKETAAQKGLSSAVYRTLMCLLFLLFIFLLFLR